MRFLPSGVELTNKYDNAFNNRSPCLLKWVLAEVGTGYQVLV